jgi:hypothetical protein
MKKNLFLYLFIFAVLINVFTYMYFTNKNKYDSGRIVKMQKTLDERRDSIKAVNAKMEDASYFSLENNDNAMEYFAGQDVNAIAVKVREGIDKLNQNKGGNPLVQYPSINGVPFIINKVRLLNHRWIIADFSAGSVWGEVLIKYFVDSDGTISYEPLQTLIYSDTVN